MKHISQILAIFFLIIFYACKTQPQSELQTWTTEIIGTWLSTDDPDLKIKFESNGKYKQYIDNELQSEVYSYLLTSSCGSNSNDIYMKIYASNSDITCHVINGFHTDENGITTLSITTERGQLEIYTK